MLTSKHGHGSTWLALIVTLILLMALSACGQTATEAPAPTESAETAPDLTVSPEATAVSAPGQQSEPAVTSGEGEKLQVVATTTIVADVVQQVGGDAVEVFVLLPVGADPHSFEPSPQDITSVAEADAVFVNGGGLEEFLTPLLENAGISADKVFSVSEGIELRAFTGEDAHAHEEADLGNATAESDHAHDAADQEHNAAMAESDHEHEQTGGDPHTWTDPNNVMVWTDTIYQALSELDPANAQTYQAHAQQYRAELADLDVWVQEQVARIPEENRQIVTDHQVFGYFADRYGLIQVGTIVPGYSTLSEPSAQELAALEDAIRDLNVKAVFVGNTVNPSLAERVAEDTGTQLVTLLTGSLTEAGGSAPTYLDYIRYNVDAMVSALR